VGSLLLLLAAAASACGAVRRQSEPLAGTSWILTELRGRAPAQSGGALTLRFEAGGRLGGNSGCNEFAGSYVSAAGSWTTTDMVSTLRACAEQALNEQEAEFHAALAAATAYEIVGDRLAFRDSAGNTVLVFVRD
jgi:putative lipoprotein